jgi:ABC-type nitrate/sulfonate/bicarbonate transport system permease component
MLTTALKPNDDMYRPEPLLVPVRITLSHFHKVFFDSHFPEFFRNSAIVALATTVLSLLVGIFAAYAIVRLDFRGKNLIARGLIFSYLVPPVLLFIPLFELIFKVGLLNTREGLILAYLTFTVPFTTWLLMGYFRTVPVALEEAALVDGCTRLMALFRIILPLSMPAIVVTALFSFTLLERVPVCADLYLESGIPDRHRRAHLHGGRGRVLLGGDDGCLLSHRHSPGRVVPAGAALGCPGVDGGSGEGIAARSRNGQKRRSQRTRGKRRRVRQRQVT